jgi:CheY-like chemotaxis protein
MMSKHVLIADDSPFVRDQFRFLFEQIPGCTVSEANDGWQALEKSERLHPDIVVLDYSMPGLDGLNTARELRRTSPEIPLVLFSVDDSPWLRDMARRNGVAAVFSKLQWGELRDFVSNRLINRPHAA